jgi:ParB/RepB/Spo0J family partition protein
MELNTIAPPALSPAQLALLDALRPGADERSVAREISTDVPDLRTQIERLARHLNLPKQGDHGGEFSQLVRTADQLAKERDAQVSGSKNGHGDLTAMAEWQKKLVVVAHAVARGVIIVVDPLKLRPMPGQPRDFFPEEEQATLGDSLMLGQFQDIIIRKKPPSTSRAMNGSTGVDSGERVWRLADTEYEICDGERRWRGIMSKKLPEIRAKLIEIDDEGAYLVASVSNFNRVGHTTIERARGIERLMKGNPPFPIEIIATMQGITVSTANKLLDTLQLPPDVHLLMNPQLQKGRGEEVLGAMPSYELARLAKNPSLQEHTRDLARRYVQRELKLPQLRLEVDRVLSASGARDIIAERNQPARRMHLIDVRMVTIVDAVKILLSQVKSLKGEGQMLDRLRAQGVNFNAIIDMAEESLEVVGAKREPKKR